MFQRPLTPDEMFDAKEKQISNMATNPLIQLKLLLGIPLSETVTIKLSDPNDGLEEFISEPYGCKLIEALEIQSISITRKTFIVDIEKFKNCLVENNIILPENNYYLQTTNKYETIVFYTCFMTQKILADLKQAMLLFEQSTSTIKTHNLVLSGNEILASKMLETVLSEYLSIQQRNQTTFEKKYRYRYFVIPAFTLLYVVGILLFFIFSFFKYKY